MAFETEQAEETTAAEAAMNQSHRDAMKPCPESAGLTELGKFLERVDERILEDIHRVVARPEKARREPENGRRMTPIEKLFRSALAFPSAEHEPRVVLRVSGAVGGVVTPSRLNLFGRVGRIGQRPRQRTHHSRV